MSRRRASRRAGPVLAAAGLAALTWLGVVVTEPGLAVSGVMTRGEIWRLATFTEAVLVLLGALSGWISRHVGSRGVRDVAGEGSPTGDEANEGSADRPAWVTVFGLWLMTIYVAGWLLAGLL